VNENIEERGWVTSRFARLSTALKMLLILTVALFPLGLVAILASVHSARQNYAEQVEEISALTQMKAQRVNSAVSRSSITIRAANAALALSGGGSETCRETLQRLGQGEATIGRFALYGPRGAVACASPGFEPPAIPARSAGGKSLIELSPDGQSLRLALFDPAGAPAGYWEYSRAELRRVVDLPGSRPSADMTLAQGNRRMVLSDGYRGGPLVRALESTAPVDDGRIVFSLRTGAAPIRPAELLTILLPILMWLAAGIIGWLVADRLLLRPLARMQRAITAYRPGDRSIALPPLSTPAHEIRELGLAFDQVTRTVARHEAELEAAVERQTRLVREVHHRVKNNLQVVASLLNLHARGATSEDVAAAYASIQRRVDALAVVHRNHYAELEENRGVALRSLISELGANLRATAPASAVQMQIRLDIEPYYVNQDVAVSVAFLITELVEFAMFCGASSVAIALEGRTPTTARLSVEAENLKGGTTCDERLFERFDRVVTGLSRQLRSTMHRDAEAGRYELDIAVVDRAER
jgi:hypothetical protein